MTETEADLGHRLQVAAHRRQTRYAANRANQIVPEGTVAGNALIVVISIMSFLACLTLGAAAFLVFTSEKQLAIARAADRAFDVHAREATDALADLRAAQQGYVAAGQGVGFWIPKVAAGARSDEDFGQLAQSPDWELKEPDPAQWVWTDDYSIIVGAVLRRLKGE